ncbi:WXG100 family type VII secretion target [Actinorugispora endophytica]|uniref:ESAT-6-like protein n=1 Tax=Actinorugispora endophytica TaxID=1605990 RepID=A0A4R6UDA3_9ACTN|nr:WXG100 family type VII secretion target [Actinorugispora endophytica]TDQ44658.1 WXG100 family type VII secretion target [Actinorugispora endophytica]
MSDFSITYSRVDQATQDVQQQTEAVSRAIEELDGKIQAVRQDFIGSTAEQYDAKVKYWRSNVDDMRYLLGKAQAALNSIRNNYSATDGREAMRWSELL